MPMLTQECLKQVYYVDKDIKRVKLRIRMLDDTLTDISKKIDDMPKGSMNDKIGRLTAEKVDLERRLEQLKSDKEEAEKQVSEDIEIFDDYTQTIMRLRYVELHSWRVIANKINSTEDAVRMYITRALKNQSE